MNSEIEKNEKNDAKVKVYKKTGLRGLLKSGLSLSVLTLLSRIFGLVRQMTLAKFLGTSSLADAY
ncbi:MAG: hypothetical protein J6S91_11400, partial [Treponema sp.]|nr:hypothetical protein [Treponema sp.]